MGTRFRVSQKQRRFYELLREAEAAGRRVTRDEILTATGYAESSFGTNLGKGLYSRFLAEVSPDTYEVTGTRDISVERFVQLTTQSLYVRELGYNCSSRLAKALLRKSRDNMILALELYNRPSLENRLDAFVLLFCAAWEQLLKARLIERDGEEAIFKKAQKGRPRETISLAAALDALFPAHDRTRRNLSRVKFLRDQATHLTMPEVQGVASRLFQSGVLNYAREFREFAQQPFLPGSPVGLLTLVVDTRTPEIVHLKGVYGAKVGAEVLELVRTLKQEIADEDDSRFAVPLDYSLVFSKDKADADISLSRATGAAREAVVIEKTRNVEDTHPYNSTQVEANVMAELEVRLRGLDLAGYLPGRSADKPCFNNYDLQAVLHREGWKNSNNEYHHLLTEGPPALHRYSPAIVSAVVEKIVGDDDYLARARERLAAARRKKQRKKGDR